MAFSFVRILAKVEVSKLSAGFYKSTETGRNLRFRAEFCPVADEVRLNECRLRRLSCCVGKVSAREELPDLRKNVANLLEQSVRRERIPANNLGVNSQA